MRGRMGGAAVGADTPGRGPATPLGQAFRRLWQHVPEGRSLPLAAWRTRHRGIVRVLWCHVFGVFVFGLLSRHSVAHSLGDSLPVLGFAVAAMVPRWSRTLRASMATLGLMTSSAMLVHLAN